MFLGSPNLFITKQNIRGIRIWKSGGKNCHPVLNSKLCLCEINIYTCNNPMKYLCVTLYHLLELGVSNKEPTLVQMIRSYVRQGVDRGTTIERTRRLLDLYKELTLWLH